MCWESGSLGSSPDSVAHRHTLGKLLNAFSISIFKMGRLGSPKRSLFCDFTSFSHFSLLPSPWMLPCPLLLCDLREATLPH